jgi:hypothetical protein
MTGELAVVNYSAQDLELMAKRVAESRLMPSITTPQAAFTLMLTCQADGLHPGHALRRYHVIDGKLSMRADAMQAEFQRQGGKVRWLSRTDERVAAEFSHAAGGTIEVEWDKARAVQAGLWDKSNWKKYPRQMLSARVISEGVRTILPGVVVGIYTPEEVQDFDDAPRKQPRPSSNGNGHATPPPAAERVINVEVTPDAEPESKPKPEPAAEAPPRETWSQYLYRTVKTANDAWQAEMATEGIPKQERKDLINTQQLVNKVVTRSIDSGRVKAEELDKDGKPGVRDPQRAKQAAEALYVAIGPKLVDFIEGAKDKSGRRVGGYLSEKRRAARAELSMFDPEAPEEEEPLPREPGCDG